MDLGIIYGILLGIVLILVGIWTSGGQVLPFLDIGSLVIVLGGTVAAVLVQYGLSQMKQIIALVRLALVQKPKRPEETIRTIVRLGEIARRDGLLAMEDQTADIDDTFLRDGIQLIVDGSDPELVKSILEIEMAFLEERHRQGQGMFQFMGAVSPAFGMIGTLIGLIIMLGNLNDPDRIGPGLAVALITTLYGSFFSNLIFIPLAGKLRALTDEEILLKEIITEGILSIQQGENPRVIEQKLKSFLAPTARFTRDQPARSGTQVDAEGVVSPGVR